MKVKLLFICALAAGLAQTILGQTPTSQGYLLAPGDVVSIRVLGEADFNVEKATIDEDGKIQIPFADEGLMVKCKTEKDIRAEIIKIYSRMLRNPQVNVQILERKSRPPVIVSGEVVVQQQVDLKRKARLLELINFAGGLKKEASGMIEIFHTQPPVCKEDSNFADWSNDLVDGENVPSRLFSYNNVKLNKEESNPVIYPGDLIVARKAPPVYVIGEVMVLKELTIPENGLSLMQAIAQAGGLSREARKKEVIIQRFNPSSPEKRDFIKVNYEQIRVGKEKDVMLQPDDIVVVEKTKKSIAQIILEYATGSARQFTQVLPQRILY
jgi:protein involved in polysaccharide export with SLBB domain